ncbi:MAG: hypothetical protein Q9174_005378, partial [Haloplaca sp. 1 TL-2023]
MGCDDDQVPAIATALTTLHRTLYYVIPETRSSRSHRTAAYETFIKDSSRADFVADLMTDVIRGTVKHPPVPPWSTGSPTFVCVLPNMLPIQRPDGTTGDAYDTCKDGHTAASYTVPGPFILLCPIFFRLNPAPPAN